MARTRKNNSYKNPFQIQTERGNRWYNHYLKYLSLLTFQLFEWENLPETVDPRFLEMSLHQFGHVGFYNDPNIGYLALQGSPSGTVNHYLLPSHFHAASPTYQETFKAYAYDDLESMTEKQQKKLGVIIWNNDFHLPSTDSIEMFAQDLAELKEVIYVNQNAQKTPVILAANDMNLFSIKQAYQQFEGNAPVILANENFNIESFKAIKTDAPYVVDKLNSQKNAVWNEIMTWLGIKNANLEKRERMIKDEANSNDEQIEASGNVMLKARKEACDKINSLYGLNLKVKFRTEIQEEILQNVSRETKEDDTNE